MVLLLLLLFQPLLLLIVFLLELLQLLLLPLLELLLSLFELLLLPLIGPLLLPTRIVLVEFLPLLGLLLLPLIGLLLLPTRIVLFELLALLDLLLFDLLTLLVLLVPQILKFLLVPLLELRVVIVAPRIAGPRRWRTVVIAPGVPRVCRSVPRPVVLVRLACNVRRRRPIDFVRPGHRGILFRPWAIWVPLRQICPVHGGVLCRTLPNWGRHLDIWTSRLNVLRLFPSHL